MQQPSLRKILKKFSHFDWKNLMQQLENQKGKQAAQNLKLLKMLKANLEVSRQEIFESLHPNTPYDSEKLTQQFSKLNQRVQTFLVQQQLTKQPEIFQKLLTESFNQRKLWELAIKKMETEMQKIQKKSSTDVSDFLQLYQLSDAHFYHPKTDKFQGQVNSLKIMSDNLDDFYLLAKLRLSAEILGRKKVWKGQELPVLLPEILQLAKQKKQLLFQIYLKIIQHFQTPENSPNDFTVLIDFYKKYFPNISKKDQAILLQLLINIAIQLKNSGHLKTLHELYQFGVQHELFIYQKIMASMPFINIVVTACMIKDFETAKQFIKNNKGYLTDNEQEAVANVSLAYLAFHQNQFRKTQAFLQKVTLKTPEMKLRVNSLLLRCWFEDLMQTKEKDYKIERGLKSHIRNFKRFLNSDQSFLAAQKKPYFHLMEALWDLQKHRADPPGIRKNLKADLLERLEVSAENPDSLSPIAAKNWLLKKIEAF